MASISYQMRDAWAAYACKREKMTRIGFGPDSILVAPETVDAWRALESVLAAFDYHIRIDDTDSYNCREIKSGGAKSLHSYGIALDINWKTNPYLDHAGSRKPRFSDKPTQDDRAEDVRLGKADTDMTRAMVDAALAIRTGNGKQVFGWGGDWLKIKDGMHFQIQVTPGDLATGIDWSTVSGGAALAAEADLFGHLAAPAATAAAAAMDNGVVEMGLPAVFFDTVRGPLFGGSLSQTAVDNMTTIVRYWLDNFPDNPLNQLAYILATVRAEVGGNMHPVRETFAANDDQARQRLAHMKYGKPDGPHGHVYYGRGYVQLTWLENYEKQSKKLGIDLVQFPDEALKPEIAIHILVRGMMDGDFNKGGTGPGLSFYVNETKQDFGEARRTVNIQDRAAEIAGFANIFLSALQKARAAQGPSLGLSKGGKFAQPDMEHVVAEPQPPAAPAAPQIPVAPGTALGSLLAGLQPSDYRILLSALGVDEPTRAKLEEVLGALEKAGVIKPASGLTPVNGALGETLGKLLDGKKTAIGVILMLVSVFLPQFAPIVSVVGALTGTAGDAAQSAAGNTQSILMPLASLLAGWGALGKIDKWLHKPAVTSVADVLSKIGK